MYNVCIKLYFLYTWVLNMDNGSQGFFSTLDDSPHLIRKWRFNAPKNSSLLVLQGKVIPGPARKVART